MVKGSLDLASFSGCVDRMRPLHFAMRNEINSPDERERETNVRSDRLFFAHLHRLPSANVSWRACETLWRSPYKGGGEGCVFKLYVQLNKEMLVNSPTFSSDWLFDFSSFTARPPLKSKPHPVCRFHISMRVIFCFLYLLFQPLMLPDV